MLSSQIDSNNSLGRIPLIQNVHVLKRLPTATACFFVLRPATGTLTDNVLIITHEHERGSQNHALG
jgi:hypothetical protein